jgi:hypothetical protein
MQTWALIKSDHKTSTGKAAQKSRKAEKQL